MAAGLLAFGIALFASLMLTVPVRALAMRVGMVDLPGPRKVHLQPIPLLGGLAMWGAIMLAVLFAFDGPARAQSIGIVTGATLVAAVGFLDDKGWLHHQIKLFVAMPLRSRNSPRQRNSRAGVRDLHRTDASGYALDAALTVFWVVGHHRILQHPRSHGRPVRGRRRHGLHLLRDDRATSTARRSSPRSPPPFLAARPASCAGISSPAKIFMGDGGAMFLGFLMATLGLKLRLEHAKSISGWLVPVLILGVHNLRHDARDDFAVAPRPHPIYHARQGPHRAPSGQSRLGPARCSARNVFSRRD